MKYLLVLVLSALANYMHAEIPRANTFPDGVSYEVQPFFKYRPDGDPGRMLVLQFKGSKLFGTANLEIIGIENQEVIQLEAGKKGVDSLVVLLPPEVGLKKDEEVQLTLQQGKKKLSQTINVPAMRHWTVYVYPHSHVDVGYSNTHANVEIIHNRNIDQGMLLAEKTRNYPKGARYRWNPEVMWPVERYMHSATVEKRKSLLDAVKRGEICLDASYLHVNTSTCSEEEMIQLFRHSRDIEKETGKQADVMVQVDIPGMSWGIVPVMVNEGVKYIMMMPNSTRGNGEVTYTLNQKPFWWLGQDGKSKVLFFQPGSYTEGLRKGITTGRPWFGQQDPEKIPEVVKTDNPREYFLDEHLFYMLPELEKKHHPYDIYVTTWAMWDNAPLDADLPEAVNSWNKEYAYPRLVISGAHEIMQTIENLYGDQLPVVKGDYTEYWTDNMGVAARENKMNRNAKERLLQAETVWSMLHPLKPSPRKDFDEAWRYIMLSTEHTYATENPMDPFFFHANWKAKQSYFREGEDRSRTLLNIALAPATDRSLGAMGPKEGPSNGGVAVINTHSWDHGGLVTLNPRESQLGNRVIDDRGMEVRSQRLSTGELIFLASDVPAMGSRHYRVVPGECSLTGTCKANDNIIENGILQIEIDKKSGNVVRLAEISSGRNFADPFAGGLNTFRWQPSKEAGNTMPDTNIVISLKETGPLLVEIQVSSQAMGCRSVVRRIRLMHGQAWVEFSNTVDKLPLLAKDGIHFGYGFNVPGNKTYIDIPWSVMQVEKDQWPEANRAWMATQHWVDISNDTQGVTWCSLDAALIESGSITANNTGDWDGAGDVWPSKLSQSPLIYSWAMNNHWFTNTPPTQDGPVTFRYRVLPHGAYDAANANRFGLEQAQPLVHVLCSTNPIEKPAISIDNKRVFINILKSTENGKSSSRLRRGLTMKP